MGKKYFAFISYKREDEEWAIWLQHELEYYHLPVELNGKREELEIPQDFRPVFRDIDELKAGRLSLQISEALKNLLGLIKIKKKKRESQSTLQSTFSHSLLKVSLIQRMIKPKSASLLL